MKPDYAIPVISMDGKAVLDVGCGNGDALMHPHYASAKARVGVDVDTEALADGRARFPELQLMHGSAEALPCPAEIYDVVISRVALPYTDIRTAMSEIRRVMKAGGDLFLTMHDWRHQVEFITGAIRQGALKRVLDHAYIVPASAAFIATGRVPSRPGRGTRETFQTERSMRRELGRAGFSSVAFSRSPRHWRITAVKT